MPVQHLSIRIPWKDNGYTGLICANPSCNNSCLRLKGIAEKRDEFFEKTNAGQSFAGREDQIPCLSEGGAFMSQTPHNKKVTHPYKESSPDTHGHFAETSVVYPAFSLPARPFRWTFKPGVTNAAYDLAGPYCIDYNGDREPRLSWKTVWVQEAENHKAIFNYFYKNVKPKQSLCIPYAKQVPFIEDRRRVVMGIGFVTEITSPIEHKCVKPSSPLTWSGRSLIWETMIHHSIRDGRTDGFLFPYREMMEYAQDHPDFDMVSVTVFASDGFFDEFSYATEHLSYDATIDVLTQSIKALKIIQGCIPEKGNWQSCIDWLKERICEVWRQRGAYPGLGAMLCAFGFSKGLLMADTVKDRAAGNEQSDTWQELDRALNCPKDYFDAKITQTIDATLRQTWMGLPKQKKSFFQLLSRFSLTIEQARHLYGYQIIGCSEQAVITNPYILYEKTRLLEDSMQISIKKVDIAIAPVAEITERFPLLPPSALDSATDQRRIRALAINVLEDLANKGHTFYPQSLLVREINELTMEPSCPVTGDILANESIHEFFADEIYSFDCEFNGQQEPAFQLNRLLAFDKQIRDSVKKRLGAPRHNVNENWDVLVSQVFPNLNNDFLEQQAHQEKVAILQELAAARISVLLGGAGTGKTTLLSILCSSPAILNGGILLLAPTGKARVRMMQAMQERKVNCTTWTVAQFQDHCKLILIIY